MRYLRSILVLAAVLATALVFAACGDDDDDKGDAGGGGASAQAIKKNDANSGKSLTIGSKNFTEQKVLGEIYAQAFEAAGYTVKTELSLGDENIALKAVKSGQVDAYPEYTGTALLSFFNVKDADLPKEAGPAFELAKSNFAKDGLTALPPTPFTSSNEVGLTGDKATELGVKTISDLEGKSEDLTLYGSPECRQRRDCLLGLQQVYGLKFKEFKPVAIDLRHEVLDRGQADLSIVFTTDPQIKRNKEVLLEDDKGMFPPYNSTLVFKDAALEKAGPDVQTVVNQVNKGLTDDVMQELNARVDLDKKQPSAVAGEYLKETGLVG